MYLYLLGLPPQTLPQLLVLMLVHLLLPLLLHTVGPQSAIRLARFDLIHIRLSNEDWLLEVSQRKAGENWRRATLSRTPRRLPARELLEQTYRSIVGSENARRRDLVRLFRTL